MAVWQKRKKKKRRREEELQLPACSVSFSPSLGPTPPPLVCLMSSEPIQIDSAANLTVHTWVA